MADGRIIPEEALLWIAALASNASRLALVTEAANELGPQLTTTALRGEFTRKSGLPPAQASLIVSGLFNLLHTVDHMGDPISDVLPWIASDLEKNAEPNWNATHLPEWRAAAPAIIATLDPDGPIAVLHKTTDLSHAHENVWLSAQIFTDIRPVFSADAKRILRSVVTHMLAVTYQDTTNEERETYFALDSADIKKLHAACERALTKVATVKTAVAGLPWSTDIAGETP